MDTNKVLSISVWNLPGDVFSEASAKKRKSFHELVAKTVGTHIGIDPQKIEIRTMRQLVVDIDPKKNPRKAMECRNPPVSIQINWCDEHRGAQIQEIGGDGFIAMQTLYLKHYHPTEFYAALLNNAKGSGDNLSLAIVKFEPLDTVVKTA